MLVNSTKKILLNVKGIIFVENLYIFMLYWVGKEMFIFEFIEFMP